MHDKQTILIMKKSMVLRECTAVINRVGSERMLSRSILHTSDCWNMLWWGFIHTLHTSMCFGKVKAQDTSSVLHTEVTGGPALIRGGITVFKIKRTKNETQFCHFRSRIWGNSLNIARHTRTTVSGPANSQHRLAVKVEGDEHRSTLQATKHSINLNYNYHYCLYYLTS